MTSAPTGMVVYLDTSALVKRYVAETGSSWIIALCHPPAGSTIATAQITKAEAAAAFASKHRSGGLSQSASLDTATQRSPSHPILF